jgi:hypothetical protein
VERGSKTASNSYILWPARIGAFSVVVGRHYGHPDTCDFLFSYLTEHNGETVLAPGSNLRRVGLIRDASKWPRRDRRKSPKRLDLINFELLSPYTIQKVLKGHQLLTEHKATDGAKADYLACAGARMTSSSIDNGIRLYGMAIAQFLGDCLVKRLENKQFESPNKLKSILSPEGNTGTGKWADLAGLFAPEEMVQKMLDDIESGAISTLEQVDETFRLMYENYPAYEWAWTVSVLRHCLSKTVEKITADDIIELINKWKTAVRKLGRMRLADAQKEYTAAVRTGYGFDGDEKIKDADFEAVRGTFEENSFVAEIEKQISTKTKLADELIKRLGNCVSASRI